VAAEFTAIVAGLLTLAMPALAQKR